MIAEVVAINLVVVDGWVRSPAPRYKGLLPRVCEILL
jgi:hypothetical protein